VNSDRGSGFRLCCVSGFGLAGWRWLLILEGFLPGGGIVPLFYLTDWPKTPAWLAPAPSASDHGRARSRVREKKGPAGTPEASQKRAAACCAGSCLSSSFAQYQRPLVNIWLPKSSERLRLSTLHVILVVDDPELCARRGHADCRRGIPTRQASAGGMPR